MSRKIEEEYQISSDEEEDELLDDDDPTVFRIRNLIPGASAEHKTMEELNRASPLFTASPLSLSIDWTLDMYRDGRRRRHRPGSRVSARCVTSLGGWLT